MSDILTRLVARAKGSPLCLVRRTPYRFEPIDEQALGRPGHDDRDALTEAIETTAVEGRSLQSHVAARAQPTDAGTSPAEVDQGETAALASPAPDPARAIETAGRPPVAAGLAPASAPAATVESTTTSVAQLRADGAAVAPARAPPARHPPHAEGARRDEAAPSPARAHGSPSLPTVPITQSGTAETGSDGARRSHEAAAQPPTETAGVRESPPPSGSRPADKVAAPSKDAAARSHAQTVARPRRSAQSEPANTVAPEAQQVRRDTVSPDPDPSAEPVAAVPSRPVPEQPQRVEDSVAATTVRRRTSAAAGDVTLSAAPLAAEAPRSSAMPAAEMSVLEDVVPGDSTGRTPKRPSATQSLLPAATERSAPVQQAAHDWAGDRLAPSPQRANAQRDQFRQRTAERLANAPARRASDTRPRRAEEPAPAQPPAASTDEIHIDIGNIQIALPRARPRRARPEPPPLQGKPRTGPDG